jgi:pimeloyl-ACP methyl ester carboxylesterase
VTAPILRSAVLMAGSGPPVLLLHGSASSAMMWTAVIEALKSRFRLIAPDLIGYGRTDPWPNGHDFSIDDELRLIEPLIHAPAHVVAHSYGGVIALAMARAARVPIRSLTLIEPVAFYVLRNANEPEAWAEAEAFGNGYLARAASGDSEDVIRHFVDYWSSAGNWDAMDEGSRAQLRRSVDKLAHDFKVVLADPDADMFDIRLPVQLLAGDKSPLQVRRIAAVLAERLPSASLQVVSGANHLLPVTHHRTLSNLLLKTLT